MEAMKKLQFKRETTLIKEFFQTGIIFIIIIIGAVFIGIGYNINKLISLFDRGVK